MKLLILLLLSACFISTASAQPGMHTSKEPLYVIDSFIVGKGFASINLNEIKEVTVLNNATSASKYGALGQNGVIFIKTKQPSKYRFLPLKEILLLHNLSLDGSSIVMVDDVPIKDTGLLKLNVNNIKSVTLYSNGFNYLSPPNNALKVIRIFTGPNTTEPTKSPGTLMIRGGL